MWDAQHVYGRLRELARQDPLLRRHGSWQHGYELGPRLSANQVERFERTYGIELPSSYRSFLLEVGDGGAGPFFGIYRHDGSGCDDPGQPLRDHEPGFLSAPFPHSGPFHADLDDDEDLDEAALLCGSMVLAHAGCGVYRRLVLTGPERGQVWVEDLYGPNGLLPGPDFHDWYLEWLDDPPSPELASPRVIRLGPDRYRNASIIDD